MNTDGPFCPLARVYDEREAAELFSAFGRVRQEVWEFNVDHWPFVRQGNTWLRRKTHRTAPGMASNDLRPQAVDIVSTALPMKWRRLDPRD